VAPIDEERPAAGRVESRRRPGFAATGRMTEPMARTMKRNDGVAAMLAPC
jgi:hypothetical protein